VPLSITVNGQGGVRWGAALCKPANGRQSEICERILPKGQPVTLEAQPVVGQSFAGWAGACQGQGPRCQITPNGPITVAATFQLAGAAQTVTIRVLIPEAGGTVRPAPFANAPINCVHTIAGYSGGTCLVTIARGSAVGFVATPEKGATFTGWASDQYGCSGQKCEFKADNPVILTARFAVPDAAVPLTVIYPVGPVSDYELTTSPTLKFDCKPLSSNLESCTAMAPKGSAVSLQATGHVGVSFTTSTPVTGARWAGACKGTTGNICPLAMNEARTVEIKSY
jgi:hypothetical protein